MTNRVPLIVDSANTSITELPAGDFIELDSSGIANANLANIQILGGNAGQVIATDGLGSLVWVDQGGGGGGGSAISNGATVVSIPVFNGNILNTVNGNDIAILSSTGIEVIGKVDVSGNINSNANILASNIESNNNIKTNTLTISGNISSVTIGNPVTIDSNVVISGFANITSNANVNGRLDITGNLTGNSVNSNISGFNTLNVNLGGFNNIFTGNLNTGNITSTGSGINFNGRFLSNVALPLSANMAATKGYVDTFVQGISVKTAADTATVTSLASSTGGTITYNNGTDGVGATLTTDTNLGTIGGLSVSAGQRVLVKNETNTAHNGIYTVTSPTVLTRATDADTPTKLNAGIFVFIESGTLESTGWVQVLQLTTIGTDPVEFNQFAGAGTYTAGDNLELNGTEFRLANTVNIFDDFSVSNGNANISTLNVSGVSDLNNVGNVKIHGGNAGQFLQTDGANNLAYAHALENFLVSSGNGISIANGLVTETGSNVTVTNTGVISYDSIRYPDESIGDDPFEWDFLQGQTVFLNSGNATWDNEYGWRIVPNANNARGAINTVRDYVYNNPNAHVLFETKMQTDGTADGYNIYYGTNQSTPSTSITGSGDPDGGMVVNIDFYNYRVKIFKGSTQFLNEFTNDNDLRTGASWHVVNVLHRYVDVNNTYVYVFINDKLIAWTNIGSWTPTGNNLGISAYTGGLNARVRCHRFIVRNGNEYKYRNLPTNPNLLTFNYNGSDQTWVAPLNCTKAYVTVQGASGGNSASGFGGKGANIHGFVDITPGGTYTIVVGGQPQGLNNRVATYGYGGNGGFNQANTANNGSAGGGLSGIFLGTPSIANAIVIGAGGGGGRGQASGQSGGNATVLYNAWNQTLKYDGTDGAVRSGSFPNAAGKRGTGTAGGAAGTPTDTQVVNPTSGSALQGGNGGNINASTQVGGGGGGAGYYGGGGAASGGDATGGGGGGASYSNAQYRLNLTGGSWGNGIVTIRTVGKTV